MQAATRAAIITLGYGFATFVFAYFVAIYGAKMDVPLFGRGLAQALVVLLVIASFALIGLGVARLLRPRRF